MNQNDQQTQIDLFHLIGTKEVQIVALIERVRALEEVVKQQAAVIQSIAQDKAQVPEATRAAPEPIPEPMALSESVPLEVQQEVASGNARNR